jgi:Zn-dependent protease
MFLAVLQLFNLLPIDPLDGGRFVNELIIALRPEWYNKVFAADKILAGLIAIALVVLVMSSLITEHDVGFFENAIRALEIGIALSLISSSLNKDRFNASYGGVSGKIDGNKIAIYAASYLLMVATFAVFALATIFNPEVAEAFMGMASI